MADKVATVKMKPLWVTERNLLLGDIMRIPQQLAMVRKGDAPKHCYRDAEICCGSYRDDKLKCRVCVWAEWLVGDDLGWIEQYTAE